MIAFDYLRSAQPDWMRRMLELRVPERLHAAAFGAAAAVLAVTGAWGIERHRLSDAQRTQTAYRERFEMSERAVKRTRIYYDRVTALVSLDRQLHEIVASGDTDARRLADIANHLPGHAWLTQIARHDAGIEMEGRAQNLAVVSAILEGMLRAREVSNPTLTSAQTVSERPGESVVKYVIHVDGGRS